ncbi:MAG: SGNH/GDSL hydrolase family protein [Desulfomonilaceae bacterium]
MRLEKHQRILFIGDSFTAANDVSDSKTYYSLVGDAIGTTIFAYGCGGYGSLQEYMILDEYLDAISPDVVVWQFCYNDFFDNSWPMARERGNEMRRPFLSEDGKIFYAGSNNDSSLRHFLSKYMLLTRRLFEKAYEIESYIGMRFNFEQNINEIGLRHEGFRQSVQTTRKIMSMVRNRIPKARIVAFSVDNTQPYLDQFQEIAKEQQIEFIDGIGSAIQNAEDRGITVRSSDKFHWNETGNSICANLIVCYLRSTPGATVPYGGQ